MGVKLEIGLGLSDGIKQVSEAPVVHVGACEDGEGIALPLILHLSYDVEGNLFDVRTHDPDGRSEESAKDRKSVV